MAGRDDFVYDPDSNYDDATCSQLRNIEQEIAQKQDYLVSSQTGFDALEQEYCSDTIYLTKIESLKKQYCCLRKTRGDGNCFYRAFGFAILEALLSKPDDCERFKSGVVLAKDDLINSFGYQRFTVEDFYDTFEDVLSRVKAGCSLADLEAIFNDQGQSDYLVVFLRLIVSSLLQKETLFFSNFLEGCRTMKEFCSQEVEPMGKESDHVHITALTQALGVTVLVEYMDRSTASSKVNALLFPDNGSAPRVHLLYRPGHYDILYKSG